jgi:hypothetical protein
LAIKCQQINLDQVLGQGQHASFFCCTYLGLPLHYKKLPKASIQPLIQKIAHRLPGWKRGLLSYPGRETLVKMVLSTILTHFLTFYKLLKWAARGIDHFRRSFLWRGGDLDKVSGGHCLVKWKNCTRPKKCEGLGIKDPDCFGRALRLRWMWFNWDSQDIPWKGLAKFQDKTDRTLFFASIVIEINDSSSTPFWEARWVNGVSPKELAPNLFDKGQFKFRTVAKELHNLNWIRNLKEINTKQLMDEFILLFSALNEV